MMLSREEDFLTDYPCCQDSSMYKKYNDITCGPADTTLKNAMLGSLHAPCYPWLEYSRTLSSIKSPKSHHR